MVYEVNNEWVVEQYNGGVTKVIGKVVFEGKTLFFNNRDLDVIWDLCNWAVNGRKPEPIEGIYEGFKAFSNGGLTYVALNGNGVVNGDIIIRRHYDIESGFYIHEDRRNGTDEWCYGTRERFLAEKKASPFYN